MPERKLRGARPSPRHRLAAAQPHEIVGATPYLDVSVSVEQRPFRKHAVRVLSNYFLIFMIESNNDQNVTRTLFPLRAQKIRASGEEREEQQQIYSRIETVREKGTYNRESAMKMAAAVAALNPRNIVRALVAVYLCVSLACPPQSHADVLQDSDKLLSQLNPITGALDGLIGEAADRGNAVLQQQLEHLRSIVQEAIFDLDEVAKKRGEQLDESAVKDIALLNQYVQQNLVQLDALIGKHLDQIDQATYDRINQFNFGLANVLASIKFINTISLIQTDKDGNGISVFKQAGDATRLYIVGSGFTKHGKPSVYLSGNGIKSDYTSGFGVWGDGVGVSVTSASMGLLEVTIPNRYLPNDFGPVYMSLEIKVPTGWVGSDAQSIPLHVCGKVPRLFAAVTVIAHGKHYVRTAMPLRDLHAAVANGNNNNHDEVCAPDVTPEGWEFDGTDLTYAGENHNNYGVIVPNQPRIRCLRAYVDGTEGNAHQNIYGIQYHLIKLDDFNPCVPAIDIAPIELKYYSVTQVNLADAINGAKGGECAIVAAKAPPTATETVELRDSAKMDIEMVTLISGASVKAKAVDVDFALGLDGSLTMQATPKCVYHPMPQTQ